MDGRYEIGIHDSLLQRIPTGGVADDTVRTPASRERQPPRPLSGTRRRLLVLRQPLSRFRSLRFTFEALTGQLASDPPRD